MEPRNVVFVAVPDQLHHEVIMEALGRGRYISISQVFPQNLAWMGRIEHFHDVGLLSG